MSLLAEVLRLLEREGVAHALIGAAALAIHGVSRSTADVDLLAVDATILRVDRWAEVVDRAADVEAEVGRLVPRLPADAGRLWARLRGPGQE